MKLVKRWGVMTLVALLVLGSMGAALADDGDDPEPAKEMLEGSHPYAPDWAVDLVEFVFYWGLSDPVEVDALECGDTSGAGLFGFVPDTAALECVKLSVKKPNRGSMVSAFVHWMKSDDFESYLGDLPDMPKGQLVKQFNDDFDKSWFELPAAGEADVLEVDEDGHGPPEWVEAKKAAKKNN